jgi:hypothetical protein
MFDVDYGWSSVGDSNVTMVGDRRVVVCGL